MRILTDCAEKKRGEFSPFSFPDLLYLLNPPAHKSWLHLRRLAKSVPADEAYPAHHSSVKQLSASQQELVRQFPKAASSKLCCNVSTAAFGQGLPPESSRSRAVQFLIPTLPKRLKRVFQVFWAWLPSPLLCISLQAPFIPLRPSSAAEDHCQTGISLLFGQFVWPRLPTGSPRGHPSLLLTDRKDRGVTQLAPIKDNVITAPIVPVYICWWEEIIDLSELEQGMLENYESESCLCQETSAICCTNTGFFSIAVLINGNLPLFLPIHTEARGRVWGR